MNDPQINIRDLCKKFSEELIFRDVSLEIKSNEFVSIKGPSGCGKSTLLLILAGLIEPDAGEIYIHGKLANSPEIILQPHARKMNLLFQNLALWPHLTGEEQLRFVWESTSKGDFKEQTGKIADQIGLPLQLLTKYPSQLSRGQQQRLAIARTFISDQPLILLDEPLTALDQELRIQFLEFLKKIKKSKTTTVIVVSHDLMTDIIDYDKKIIFDNYTFIVKK